MNNNDHKCEENEYVFVELSPKLENADKSQNKKTNRFKSKNKRANEAAKSSSRVNAAMTLFSSKGAKTQDLKKVSMDSDEIRTCPSDEFSISSFDLCDEELTDSEDMDFEIDGQISMDIEMGPKSPDIDTDPVSENLNTSLHLELCPSASASVCTETLFETLKETTSSNVSGKVPGKEPSHSRLSNKKRRKKLKKQKKAAAAAAAAEALASQTKQKKAANASRSVPTVTMPVSSPTPLSSSPNSRKKAASIAVLCAAQSLAQYRQEVGVANVKIVTPKMKFHST
jgi:hypothetical protein